MSVFDGQAVLTPPCGTGTVNYSLHIVRYTLQRSAARMPWEPCPRRDPLDEGRQLHLARSAGVDRRPSAPAERWRHYTPPRRPRRAAVRGRTRRLGSGGRIRPGAVPHAEPWRRTMRRRRMRPHNDRRAPPHRLVPHTSRLLPVPASSGFGSLPAPAGRERRDAGGERRLFQVRIQEDTRRAVNRDVVQERRLDRLAGGEKGAVPAPTDPGAEDPGALVPHFRLPP